MTIIFWDEDYAAYDELWVNLDSGTSVFIGYVTDVTVKRKIKIDKQAGAGITGATTIDKGVEPSDVDITGFLVSRAHMATFKTLMKEAIPTKGVAGSGKPRTFTHPLIQFHDLKVLKIEEVEGPKLPKKGMSEFKLKCTEFLPPKKTPVKKAVDPSQGIGSVYNTEFAVQQNGKIGTASGLSSPETATLAPTKSIP
jgi:hypothetical protein